MKSPLTGSHRKTYHTVFQHPTPRNLQWRDVWSMLGAMVDSAVEEQNGNLKITWNGRTLTLHRPRGKDLADVDELSQIRHFIERSRVPVPQPAPEGTHLLVVIDHREARVYKIELHRSRPQRIIPDDPHGDGRHLHYVQDDSNGQRKPERKSFYEAVAKAISGAQKILVFGSGTGASSAMEHLLAELKNHRGNLDRVVVSSMIVDDQHLTENQLLAKARDFYANAGSQPEPPRLARIRTAVLP
jgi:hypothetical protein